MCAETVEFLYGEREREGEKERDRERKGEREITRSLLVSMYALTCCYRYIPSMQVTKLRG